MAELVIRPADAGDLAVATQVCLRSKAHWGYDAAFMQGCRAELTLTEADLRDLTLVALQNEAIVGVLQLAEADGSAEIEKLFVDPQHMRRGIGRKLLEDALRAAGSPVIRAEADPQAVLFYEKLGFVRAGEAASGSIPGRTLPVMFREP